MLSLLTGRMSLSDSPSRPQAPSVRVSELDARSTAITILLVATFVVLEAARGYGGARTPLGDDASSHTATIATFAKLLMNGQGWWSTDYNLGFPLGLYYQPVPHVVSAAFCALLGGPEMAIFTYKFFSVAMIALQPWAVAFGLRRAGADRLTSAIAGALAPFVINPEIGASMAFGYSVKASLNVGLYTQNWGNVALPIVFGELVALIDKRGRIWTTALAAAFTAGCHMFYAIALVPIMAILALLMPGRAASVRKLAGAGAVAFALVAPWQIALFQNQAYFGGWPNSSGERLDGYGWSDTFSALVSGDLLDGTTTPILTVCALLGLIVAVARFRHTAFGRATIVSLVLSLLGMVGRAPLFGHPPIAPGDGFLDRFLGGGWIDLYPLHKSVQLFRYLSLLQFLLMVLAALGISTVAHALYLAVSTRLAGAGLKERLAATFSRGDLTLVHTETATQRNIATALPTILLIAVIGFTLVKAGPQLRGAFRTIDKAKALHLDQYDELVSWMRQTPIEGRTLVGPKTGVKGHYHGGLLAYTGDRPVGLSYGVGLHDSLGFYFLMHFDPTAKNAADLFDLYDFRYMVNDPGTAFKNLDEGSPKREIIHKNKDYIFAKLPVSGQSVAIMREGRTLSSTPREAREQIRAWLNGNGPRTGTTVVLDVTNDRSREQLTTSPGTVTRAETFSQTAPPAGKVIVSSSLGDRVSATVDLGEPALIVAKTGFHPFWTATLDGAPVPTKFVFPGFFAVEAPAGKHQFEARFAWPAATKVLMAIAPLPLLFALFGESPNPPRNGGPNEGLLSAEATADRLRRRRKERGPVPPTAADNSVLPPPV